MKVSTFLSDFNSRVDSNSEESEELKWINRLEQNIYRNDLMEKSTAFITIIANQATYSLLLLPYKFEDIENLIIDEIEYDKRIDYIADENYTYYKSGTDIILIPTPLTAKANGIEVRYARKPVFKSKANKFTEELSLTVDFGEEFIDLYEYYLRRQACIFNREFTDANAYAQLYEEAEEMFWKWYCDHIPNDVATRRKAGWR